MGLDLAQRLDRVEERREHDAADRPVADVRSLGLPPLPRRHVLASAVLELEVHGRVVCGKEGPPDDGVGAGLDEDLAADERGERVREKAGRRWPSLLLLGGRR